MLRPFYLFDFINNDLMKIINTLILSTIFSLTAFLLSCTDDSLTAIEEEAQALADSIAQSEIDNDSIDWYIQSHNISNINVDETTGVRYAILSPNNGTVPELNAIVSLHYKGKFLSNVIFDTSNESVALVTDSLSYVEAYANNDTTFNDILLDTKSTLTYQEKIDSLNFSEGRINTPLYTQLRTYQPIVFNYTTDGSRIDGYIPGFEVGLKELMNLKDGDGNQVFGLEGAHQWHKMAMSKPGLCR